MITIKHDSNLAHAAEIAGTTPEELVGKILYALRFADEDDPYAGETLGTFLEDYNYFIDLLCRDVNIPYTPEFIKAFVSLRLYYEGADNPCPECGWEKSENTNDYLWHCPHCGWSEMIFLSEQNED